MKVRRIIKFEFESGHDIEFIPSTKKAATFEVWVDGVLIEEMAAGERPSEARAWYYFEVHCTNLEEAMHEDDVALDASCHAEVAVH